jgi:O-antigen ligase
MMGHMNPSRRLNLPNLQRWTGLLLIQVTLGWLVVLLGSPTIFLLFVGASLLLLILYRWPIVAFGLILLTVPSYNMILFQIGKVDIRPNDVAILLGVFTLVLQWIKRPRFEMDIRGLDAPLLLIFCWVLLSLFWTPDLTSGTIQTLKILGALLIYAVMVNLIRDTKTLNQALFIWVLVGAFWAIGGIYTIFAHGMQAAWKLKIVEGTLPHLGKTVRASTFFGGPNDFGFVLSITIMMAVLLIVLTSSRPIGVFSTAGVLTMMIVLIGTFSRKSWLGLGISILVIGLKKRAWLAMLGFFSLVALLVILWAGTDKFSDALANRFASFFIEPEVSISHRSKAWAAAQILFWHHPIVGNGVGSFSILGPEHGSPLNIPHSFHWYLLTEFGLVGFLLVTLFIANITVHLLRFFRDTLDPQVQFSSLLLLGTIASVVFQSAFKTIGLTEPIFWIFLGYTSAFIRLQLPNFSARSPWRSANNEVV